jgi:hypothetical protein
MKPSICRNGRWKAWGINNVVSIARLYLYGIGSSAGESPADHARSAAAGMEDRFMQQRRFNEKFRQS